MSEHKKKDEIAKESELIIKDIQNGIIKNITKVKKTKKGLFIPEQKKDEINNDSEPSKSELIIVDGKNDIITKGLEGSEIEFIIRDGRPWLTSSAIAKGLEIHRNNINQIYYNNKEIFEPYSCDMIIISHGQKRKVRAFDETGFYGICIKSHAPRAIPFQKKVLKIIDEINKKGYYIDEDNVSALVEAKIKEVTNTPKIKEIVCEVIFRRKEIKDFIMAAKTDQKAIEKKQNKLIMEAKTEQKAIEKKQNKLRNVGSFITEVLDLFKVEMFSTKIACKNCNSVIEFHYLEKVTIPARPKKQCPTCKTMKTLTKPQKLALLNSSKTINNMKLIRTFNCIEQGYSIRQINRYTLYSKKTIEDTISLLYKNKIILSDQDAPIGYIINPLIEKLHLKLPSSI